MQFILLLILLCCSPFLAYAGDKVKPTYYYLIILDTGSTSQNAIIRPKAYWDGEDDGFAESMDWVLPTEPILVKKAKEEGKSSTPIVFGAYHQDNMPNMRLLDSNLDGVISEIDPAYSELLLWYDENSDGNMLPAEVKTLSDAGVVELLLSQVGDQARKLPPGMHSLRILQLKAELLMARSKQRVLIEPELLLSSMPNIRGYGRMRDLFEAMSQNPLLKEEVQNLCKISFADFSAAEFDSHGAIERILFTWAGIQDKARDSRGPAIDGRRLWFLEEMLSNEWPRKGVRGNPPAGEKATLLNATWGLAYKSLMARFFIGCWGDKIFPSLHYNYFRDEIIGSYKLNADYISQVMNGRAYRDQVKSWMILLFVVDGLKGVYRLSPDFYEDANQLIKKTNRSLTYDKLAEVYQFPIDEALTKLTWWGAQTDETREFIKSGSMLGLSGLLLIVAMGFRARQRRKLARDIA